MLAKPLTCECGTHDLLQPFFVGLSNRWHCSNVARRTEADFVHPGASSIAASQKRCHERYRHDNRLNAVEVHCMQFTELDSLLRAAFFHFPHYATVGGIPTDYVAELVCK